MTSFFKVSGSGNDFVALAEPSEAPAPGQIRAWCRRGVSLGADGLFILRRDEGSVLMEYFNSDGFAADLCLNGTRCAAQLAFHLGWAKDVVTVATPAGAFQACRVDEGRIALALSVPSEPPRSVTVQAGGGTHAGWFLTVGVPHFVLLWPEGLERAPVRDLGREIRQHPAFQPAGANVNFVRFPDRHRMEMRTYERGVEDETLSCGTGTLAAAAVGLALGKAALPLRAETRGGFELLVDGDPASGRWSLAGDARVVAVGELLPGAAVSPG